MAKENAVATKEDGVLATNGKRRGFEEPIDRGDIMIPRAKLLQALSPEVVENMKSPEGSDLKSGMIINSLTKDILPAEFVPIFKFTNWIRFNPRNSQDPNFDSNFEPGAIIWRSTDPLDPKVKAESAFGENGEVPLATKFLNFFCLFPGAKMPVIVSFSKTSYKAGKQLLSLAQFATGDMFSHKYKLGAKQTKNDIGTFYVFTVEPCGFPAEEDTKIAEGLWNDFANKVDKIQVHEEGNEPDAAATDEQAPF